jgi:hypothetical protein
MLAHSLIVPAGTDGSRRRSVRSGLVPRYAAISPDRLPDELAEVLVAVDVAGRVLRVALDGPPVAGPGDLADALTEPLRTRGRHAIHIRAQTFWRDASLRLEHGRHDVESYRDWLDGDALRREVLAPLGRGGSGEYVPSLRDPVTNRATREPRRTAAYGSVLIVSGALLLGRELPFDVTIHLAVGAAARARRTPAECAWTLSAFDAYDRDVDPVGTSDVVVRLDDPAHPAVSFTSDRPASRR